MLHFELLGLFSFSAASSSVLEFDTPYPSHTPTGKGRQCSIRMSRGQLYGSRFPIQELGKLLLKKSRSLKICMLRGSKSLGTMLYSDSSVLEHEHRYELNGYNRLQRRFG